MMAFNTNYKDTGLFGVYSTHKDIAFQKNQLMEDDEEDGWSLFYTNSISIAVQVDGEKIVGPEAFARIAPVCPAIADIITVHNLCDVLSSSSASQLHSLIYDKYLGSLDKGCRKYIISCSSPSSFVIQSARQLPSVEDLRKPYENSISTCGAELEGHV